jgi:hypothetical protein
MALVGYRMERQRIDEKISEIQKRLGGRHVTVSSAGAVAKPVKRILSVAARKRIAAAQKKRWAAFHKRAAAAKQG